MTEVRTGPLRPLEQPLEPDSSPVVAIACSAGGLSALARLLSALPTAFRAPILLVQHLDPRHRSLLPQVLGRSTTLSVRHAHNGDCIAPGVVYVAPPDHHLLLSQGGVISLTQSELVHFVRPSANLLFESVAASCRESAIAVVLTGSGSDGAMGVKAIKKMGGTVVAQDEATSDYFGMPGAAIDTGDVDLVLPLEDIAPALISMVRRRTDR
jgi:two-component system chemotaxis response regulator CheB